MKLSKLLPQSKVYNGYENYRIFYDSDIYSVKGKRFLKHCWDGRYMRVSVSNNGVVEHFYVHVLVATCFIANPENKPQVNHKDCNTRNNQGSNLEWNTAQENTNHAILNGLYNPPKINRVDLSKPILQMDMQGNVLKEYPSVNEAMRVTGIYQRHISCCANGGELRISGGIKKFVRSNSAGGYKWQYKQVKEEIIKL